MTQYEENTRLLTLRTLKPFEN